MVHDTTALESYLDALARGVQAFKHQAGLPGERLANMFDRWHEVPSLQAFELDSSCLVPSCKGQVNPAPHAP